MSWREYSERFAKALFEQRPEWGVFGRFEDSGALALEIPAQNQNARSGLQISTEREEVTVGFDFFHTHFFMEDEDEKNFEQAFDFIDGLLSEQYVVIVFMRGDQWAGSRSCSIDDEWPMPEAGQRRIIRSWLGTYDAEMANSKGP